MTSSITFHPSGERIRRDWRVLCERIGQRLAGSNAEAWAADTIADRFRAAGAEVRIETCTSLDNVSAEPVCELLAAALPMVWRFATGAGAPARRPFARKLKAQIARFARGLYGMGVGHRKKAQG